MEYKNYQNSILLLFSVFLIFMHGCMSPKEYGGIRPVSSPENTVTIAEIIKGWQNYSIYYADVNPAYPSAILIDPKGDELRLTNDRWVPVKKQDELIELIKWIDMDIDSPPDLLAVLGPDEQVFGYLYTGWHHVLIKLVDSTTLWVDDSPLPINELDDNSMPGD